MTVIRNVLTNVEAVFGFHETLSVAQLALNVLTLNIFPVMWGGVYRTAAKKPIRRVYHVKLFAATKALWCTQKKLCRTKTSVHQVAYQTISKPILRLLISGALNVQNLFVVETRPDSLHYVSYLDCSTQANAQITSTQNAISVKAATQI